MTELPTCQFPGCERNVIWREGEGWLHISAANTNEAHTVYAIHLNADTSGHQPIGDWFEGTSQANPDPTGFVRAARMRYLNDAAFHAKVYLAVEICQKQATTADRAEDLTLAAAVALLVSEHHGK